GWTIVPMNGAPGTWSVRSPRERNGITAKTPDVVLPDGQVIGQKPRVGPFIAEASVRSPSRTPLMRSPTIALIRRWTMERFLDAMRRRSTRMALAIVVAWSGRASPAVGQCAAPTAPAPKAYQSGATTVEIVVPGSNLAGADHWEVSRSK